MKNLVIITLSLLMSISLLAQEETSKEKRLRLRPEEAGYFELGMRSTLSFFDHQSYTGVGYGGQFRLRPGGMLNTEWYSDYIRTDIEGLGDRETVHIGWSVMIYPFHKNELMQKLSPYLIGGNCFDYSKVTSNVLYSTNETIESITRTRWTTAVQGGVGFSYQMGRQFNLSTSVQYMQHIGNSLHVEVVDPGTDSYGDNYESDKYLVIDDDHHKEIELEGHMLATVSLNFLLFDFAK
jgi:hypothetical protein